MLEFSPVRDKNVPTSLESTCESSLPQNVSAGFIVGYWAATAALWMCVYPPLQQLLPEQINNFAPASKDWLYGLISAFALLAVLITYPLVGAISDRTVWRWGRRRSWLLIGGIGSVLMILGVAFAPNILVLALCWIILTICAYGVQIVLITLIPDRVPIYQRGVVSACIGTAAPVAIIIGLAIGGILKSVTLPYLVFVSILVIFLGLFIVSLRERPLPKEEVPRFDVKQFLASFWVNPLKYPDFGWAWLTRALVTLGYAGSLAYLDYYLRDVIHYEQLFPNRDVRVGIFLFNILSAIWSITASVITGVLSDKLKRRKVFVMLAGIFIAMAALMLSLVNSWSLVLVAAAILGMGFGIYSATDMALITQVLPSLRTHGKDMGVLNMAAEAPQALALLLGALIIGSLHNYTILHLCACAAALAGGVLVYRIRGVR